MGSVAREVEVEEGVGRGVELRGFGDADGGLGASGTPTSGYVCWSRLSILLEDEYYGKKEDEHNEGFRKACGGKNVA